MFIEMLFAFVALSCSFWEAGHEAPFKVLDAI